MLIYSSVRLPPICYSVIKKDERMADACAGTTGRENRERQGDKSGITGDTRMTCYYNVIAESGLIGKSDSYLSFPRVLGGIQSRINY
jgi:hypothetical protein